LSVSKRFILPDEVKAFIVQELLPSKGLSCRSVESGIRTIVVYLNESISNGEVEELKRITKERFGNTYTVIFVPRN
jgi:Tfp pilus assembly ATPase PilU